MAKQLPEHVQKKQARDQKIQKAAETQRKVDRENNKKRTQEWVKQAETYAKEYKAADSTLVNNKREARHSKKFFIPAEPKVALVIRIRGVNQLHPTVRKTLRLLRLRQIHNATFLKVNKPTTNMLKQILPYVTLGYPTRHLIRRMIYKRGFGKVNGQRIPLQDNQVIAQELGKFNINTVEDLVHEITTVGPHFKEANNFLWPFKLNNPKGGYSNKRHPFQMGGDWGNREEEINELVQRML